MGMTCTLLRVSPTECERLRADPAAVEEFLNPEGSAPPVVEVREKGLLGLIMRLVGIKVTKVDPNWTPPEGWGAKDDNELDLEKAWHGLHFIFTGNASESDPPGGFLLSGGEEIGDETDDSRPRLLDPKQVEQFSAFLAALTDDEFTRRFDADRMTELEIYPDVIWKREAKDHPPIEYLRGAFEHLRAFVAASTDRGDAIVVDLS